MGPDMSPICGWTSANVAVVTLLLMTACNKPTVAPTPATTAQINAPNVAVKTPRPAPTADVAKNAAKQATTAAAKEAAQYSQRRKRKPTVIGGCDERCGTPQKAASALFDGLQSKTPGETLRHLFDWSLLDLDGDKRGDRWSDMWGDRRKHGERNEEIQTWLDGWIATLRQAKPEALLRSRASGVQIKSIPKRTDVVEMRWRHPTIPDGGEREWRILWTLRGYEWLISRIDRQPSKRPLGTPPLGSVRKGHL